MRSTQFTEDMEADVNDYREPVTEYRMHEEPDAAPEEDVDLDEIFEEEDFDSPEDEEEDEGDSA